MALVVPDIVRYTINGTYLGRPMRNVLDMRIQNNQQVPLPSPYDREELVEFGADRVKEAWQDMVQANLSNQYKFESVSWIDLDSANGSVGEHADPFTGTNSGEPYVANAALVLRKNGERIRGTRQGRMFIGGLVEGAVSGNSLIPAGVTLWNNAASAFRTQLTETGVAADWWSQPVTVHTRQGAAIGVSVVTSMSVDTMLSHQDRRLTGRR